MKRIAELHTPPPATNLLPEHRRLLLSHRNISFDAICANSYSALDPHTYTSGQWLRHDKLKRDARYIKFDFDELCKKVIELCNGAASIRSYEKKEGGFNRVFIFTCDNGERIVARLPTRVAGPPRLTISSEVATIKHREFKCPSGQYIVAGLHFRPSSVLYYCANTNDS